MKCCLSDNRDAFFQNRGSRHKTKKIRGQFPSGYALLKSTINAAVDSEMNNLISDLQSLIRQASISARRQGLSECADLVSQVMTKAGIKSELLHICDKGENQDEDDAATVVYGEVRSKANPDGKTILFYNHYDVQPVEPLEFWDSEPFSAKIESNYIYGRGSADDK